MTKQVLKSIATGIFLGAVFFLMPFFILKLVAFFIIISSIFKFMAWRMFRRFIGQWQGISSTDNINNLYSHRHARHKQYYTNRGGEKKVIIIN